VTVGTIHRPKHSVIEHSGVMTVDLKAPIY